MKLGRMGCSTVYYDNDRAFEPHDSYVVVIFEKAL